ncbi:MAG: sodium:proton antiporter [Lachnospiraceae bacterium]|nr:sodium:proton antiporter [Lachnospiraceae bacterium]
MKANLILAVLVFYPIIGGLAAWALRSLAPREASSNGQGNLPPSEARGRYRSSLAPREASSNGQGSLQPSDKTIHSAGQSFLPTGSAAVTDFVAITEFIMMLVLFISSAGKAESGSVMSLTVPGICGLGLHFTLDGFRLIYGLIAGLMWMMTALLCPQYFSSHTQPRPTRSEARVFQRAGQDAAERSEGALPQPSQHSHPAPDRFYVFFLLTLGATMGVFLSADLYTTFIFFEMMSFTSYVWVAHEENNAALRAADTYLTVAVLGGLVMLMGIFGVYHELGTLTISELSAAAAAYENKPVLYALGCCMFVGFGAKAGAFPLHIWLPKAHPVAPAPASALLSGILTKTGIFGILAITSGLFLYDKNWGSLVLIIGAATMFGGALLAVFSIDLKRTLACSSMSQIGFILIGVGMQCMLGEENALAVHGTLLHMMNHSMIKLVLFMAAGVIYMNLHALDLNVIRGFGRKKPLLKVIFLIGALAIGGIPMFGGYISKTLLHESILEYGGGWIFRALEYLFLFSGGLTVAYMTKLFVAIFVEKNADDALQKKYDAMKHYMNPMSTFALSGSALVLLIWGLFPHGIMDRAAELGQSFMGLEEFGHVVSYFSWKNLSGGLISISIGVIVYVFFIRTVLMREEAPLRGSAAVKRSGRSSKAKASGRGKKAKAGTGGRSAAAVRQYINAWPSWLDLENLIYRPLLLKLLPFVFGAACSVLDKLTDTLVRILIPVGHVLARIFDSLVDFFVVGLRKSVYKDSPIPHERVEGTWLTETAGKLLNAVQKLANRTWRRSNPSAVDYRRELALRHDVSRESNTVIGRSLSYGLLLVIIGFCLTLVYILWW